MFLDDLDLDTVDQNSTSNQTTFSFTTFAVQVQQIDPNRFNGQTFIVDLGSVEQAMNSSGNIEQDALITVDDASQPESRLAQEDVQNSTAFLQLSSAFLDECIGSEIGSLSVSQRLSYSVFVSTVLFLPENTILNAVGSIILAARIKCNKTGLSMPATVRTSFQTNEPVSFCFQYQLPHYLCSVYTGEGNRQLLRCV